MTQKSAFTVVTQERNLRSVIFASRHDLVANVEPMRYEGDVPADRSPVEPRGIAVKVTINPLQPGDFVVRSVLNGRRRKFEVLAGSVPSALVAQLPEFANVEENHFIVPASAVSEEGLVATAGLEVRQQFAAGQVNDIVVLTDGADVVEFAGAVRVN